MEAAETGGTKKRNKDTEESCEDKIQRTSGELSPSKQKKVHKYQGCTEVNIFT